METLTNDTLCSKDKPILYPEVSFPEPAISWAIASATGDDVVLVAGKGHENYQLIGSEHLDFSDYGVAQDCLLALAEDRE